MLIICPSCATSYMIETASLGVGGRMVRCARCEATWFAGGPQQQVNALIDEVIAKAETAEPEPFLRAPAGEPTPPPTLADDSGTSHAEESPAEAEAESAPIPAEPYPTETSPAAYDASHQPRTITESPSLVPLLDPAADEAAHGRDAAFHRPDEAGHDRDSDSDVESFAARRQRLKSRRQRAKCSSRWTAITLVLFAFNVALIGGRSEVVRYLPQTASLFAVIGLPVNLRQLKFEKVHILPSGTGGEGLKIEGTIVSLADKPVKIPALRFAVRNAAGQEIYTWTATPKRNVLDPGEKLAFRSELASPPVDAKDVLVRFLTAQEAADMAADKATRMALPDHGSQEH